MSDGLIAKNGVCSNGIQSVSPIPSENFSAQSGTSETSVSISLSRTSSLLSLGSSVSLQESVGSNQYSNIKQDSLGRRRDSCSNNKQDEAAVNLTNARPNDFESNLNTFPASMQDASSESHTTATGCVNFSNSDTTEEEDLPVANAADNHEVMESKEDFDISSVSVSADATLSKSPALIKENTGLSESSKNQDTQDTPTIGDTNSSDAQQHNAVGVLQSEPYTSPSSKVQEWEGIDAAETEASCNSFLTQEHKVADASDINAFNTDAYTPAVSVMAPNSISAPEHSDAIAVANIETIGSNSTASMSGNSSRATRKRVVNNSPLEISMCIKYTVFSFNVLFWFSGLGLLAIGLWAQVERDTLSNLSTLTSLTFDPIALFIAIGLLVLIVSTIGCLGSLRENTLLLLIFSVSVGICLVGQLIMGFLIIASQSWLETILRRVLSNGIVKYKDDITLQEIVDWVQMDWLKCCGVDSYRDWEKNIYYNCSSPGREACGVPYTCCLPEEGVDFRNRLCGDFARKPENRFFVRDIIYMDGCVEQGNKWVDRNLIVIAGVIVGVAVLEIFSLCLALNLRADINGQKRRLESIRRRQQTRVTHLANA